MSGHRIGKPRRRWQVGDWQTNGIVITQGTFTSYVYGLGSWCSNIIMIDTVEIVDHRSLAQI